MTLKPNLIDQHNALFSGVLAFFVTTDVKQVADPLPE